jgi:hypothetical protein
LLPLALSGFTHFTAVQVRGLKVKGMDLHLKSLREACVALFGNALPDQQIRRATPRFRQAALASSSRRS